MGFAFWIGGVDDDGVVTVALVGEEGEPVADDHLTASEPPVWVGSEGRGFGAKLTSGETGVAGWLAPRRGAVPAQGKRGCIFWNN